MHSAHPARAGLLIIDMQVGLVGGPERPYELARLLANINILLARARTTRTPVYAARHTGPAGTPIAAGSPFWQLTAALDFNPSVDRVFDKHRPSCFVGTPLADWLAQDGVTQLVVAGLKTQYCVDTTCRDAAGRGMATILVSDAHSCMDTPQLAARDIIAHHNATLAGPFVQLQSAAQTSLNA
ncbi:isochorismatase family protein [Silvimonas iriomotensis]|uniref:Isochorismatase n=1 Tax=Silvimonas iriomotensis TaxID=449662 RepID=A0ABQ2PAF8_9NEIS|nr:isochorismatase family protein [Silvimonas iriomotensis]GGP22399.1 isochorismatase [Silvimonas iriomotensis]